MKARLLLADDHSITLAGMRSVIERDYDVVGEVADGRALVAEALKSRPDLIVLDVGMPMLNGIEAARQIKKAWPAAKLLFVTMHANQLYVRETMSSGGSGYVLKTSAAEELLPAIKTVLEGGVYVTPELRACLSERRLPQAKGAFKLTERQREVLQLVAEGRSSKEVAKILGIAVKTAEFHRHQLMRRLGLGSIAELAAFAVREGYIS